MRTKRALFAATVALAGTLAFTGTASAHGITYARSVQAGFGPGTQAPFTTLSGEVRKSCTSGVTVTLWRVEPGPDSKAGADKTSSKGKFQINAPSGFVSGTYYVTVPRRILVKNRFHKHICPALKTDTVSF